MISHLICSGEKKDKATTHFPLHSCIAALSKSIFWRRGISHFQKVAEEIPLLNILTLRTSPATALKSDPLLIE
jgi:hypothetical protein